MRTAASHAAVAELCCVPVPELWAPVALCAECPHGPVGTSLYGHLPRGSLTLQGRAAVDLDSLVFGTLFGSLSCRWISDDSWHEFNGASIRVYAIPELTEATCKRSIACRCTTAPPH